MPDYGCCVFAGDGDAPSCSYNYTRVARKEHHCCECDEVIAKGQRYEYYSGIWDGRPDAFKTCLSCAEIRDHFVDQCDDPYENRPVFGGLWSSIEENFFPDMTAGGPCLEGLSTAAKARMFERRIAWLFDAEIERDGARPPAKEI
jgi:hypothetical protein